MRFVSIALISALGLSLTACDSTTANRSVNSERQPVVTRSHFVLDLNTTGSGSLPDGELGRLSGWFDALELGYGDRIAIDDPDHDASPSTRSAVEAVAAQKGLLVSEIAPITEGHVPTGTMRVVVSRSTAAVPGCPDWSNRSHTDFQARTSENYGCGVNSTMAAMIADPEDLVRGQSRDGEDQTEASKAIRAYRDKVKKAGGQ